VAFCITRDISCVRMTVLRCSASCTESQVSPCRPNSCESEEQRECERV
jgi:hypothetical protein